ncbi:MAG: hypothetical protein HOH33_02055 [Verrucomicrobia bacterium]|nr:hypothetical protein [Verrucomicrobiota bacterium]
MQRYSILFLGLCILRLIGQEDPPPSESTSFPEKQARQGWVQSATPVGDDIFKSNQLQEYHLQFSPENQDWFSQLRDYYGTDLKVTGNLTIGKKTATDVGVRYKGASSYIFTSDQTKKSFDIDINSHHSKQRLAGYRKFNLNNGFLDPTLVREILFLDICRLYVPTAKANHAHLKVDEKDWGIYTSVQQINRDFYKEWFPKSGGNAWRGILRRVSSQSSNDPNINQSKPFKWISHNPADYERYYELRNQRSKRPWTHLIEVLEILDTIPDDRLEAELNPRFAIDNMLWMIALENVFMDNDSFLRKGYDYFIYEDPQTDRLHLIQHDGNEAFGTGRVGQWPDKELTRFDPFFQADNPYFQLVHRVLNIPRLRERYLAHVRVLIEDWLQWEEVLEPKVTELQQRIQPMVKASTNLIHPYGQFTQNVGFDWQYTTNTIVPGLKSFTERRLEFLTTHPDIKRKGPAIKFVNPLHTHANTHTIPANQPIVIQAGMMQTNQVSEVILHYTTNPLTAFKPIRMVDDGLHQDAETQDGIFSATIPKFKEKSHLFYYVEARGNDAFSTTTFSPREAESQFYELHIGPPLAHVSEVVINEVYSTGNIKSGTSPWMENDWIELVNKSDENLDISGYYLTDNPAKPKKWRFPADTIIEGGQILVVTTGDPTDSSPLLRASFNISAKGERILFIAPNQKGNTVMDEVRIPKIKSGKSYSRKPNAIGKWTSTNPTPNQSNDH